MKNLAIILAMVLAIAALPLQTQATAEPELMLDTITISFGQGTNVTLTDVHRHYFRFGYRMGIYATPRSTITFHGTNTPYWHGTGQLTRGIAYNLHQFSQAIGGSAVSFNLGWCNTTGTHVFPDYMDLIGGVYPWVAQLMFFMHTTFDAHRDAMHYHGYSSLLMHQAPEEPELPMPFDIPDRAPIIPSITIHPPDLAEGDNLEVTLTNAFDAVGFADITMQSARWFYLAPTGSVSFNRDMELRSFRQYDGETLAVINLPAGEVFYVYGHTNIAFHWMQYPVICCHFDFEPGVYGDRSFGLNVQEPEDAPWHSNWAEGRLTFFDVNSTPRVLRFAVGSTTFTDNGVAATLEAAPFIADDRTMVPLRVIVEALGATDLSFTGGVVSFNLMGETITMTIGQPLGNMGTPMIIAERTFVPLAFVMQEIGALANWDGEARAAYVYIF